MATAAPSVSVAPSFSLAALLLVVVGVAVLGNTLIGGLPDKILALAKRNTPTPSQGGLAGTGVAGAGGAGASTARPGPAPGSVLGPGVLGGGVGGPTQVGGNNPFTPAHGGIA